MISADSRGVMMAVQIRLTVFTTPRPTTTSRIIGAVIGVAVLLAILAFICVARRRRARSAGPILGGPGFAPGSTAKPAVGGFNRPWGQQQNQNTQWQQQQPNQGSYFPGGAPAGGKYPPPAGSSEPAPPYTPQPGTFSPPAGAPPAQGQQGYAAPPGPPPQAHVNGQQQQNNFVGGFRS
ncbi:hypothetical protein B0H14DRAFT_2909121 [Mycena olivaceomarginata]|nr:hypothetical protein B0H14DRAFT_2909121 [Mycena olivaceomarginata]